MVNFEHVIAGWEGVKGVSTVHLTFSVVDTLFCSVIYLVQLSNSNSLYYHP